MMRWLLVLPPLFFALGCGRGTSPAVPEPATTITGRSVEDVLLDDHILVPGQIVNTRDLRYRVEDLTHRLDTGNRSDPKRPKMLATVDLIEDARRRNPQCLRFRVSVERGAIDLLPVDELGFPPAESTEKVDVLLIGGEMESITTAIAFAKRSKSVAVLHAGPLGGLCSDDGGNLRFFDGYWLTPRPEEQRELYRKALKMGDFVALPAGIDSRIRSFLEAEYKDRIKILEVPAYEMMRVNMDGSRITSIDLPAGVSVYADVFLDTDPESRVAEKAGLEFDALTPNLPYGLVFDIPNITRADIESLVRNPRLSPTSIAEFASRSLSGVDQHYLAKMSLEELRKDLSSDFAHDRGNYWLGFKAVAEGFNFYMQLKGINSDSEGLKMLNRARRTSGFNIALNGGSGNFNSISYSFGFTLLQHAHSLSEDDRLRPLREIEVPELQTYLRYVANNPNLTVRMPEQFYVRKSTAHFMTQYPYVRADFKREQPESGSHWMMYPMDYRSISPRNSRERTQFNRLFWSGDVVYWQCRPNVCETDIENLYLLNKSMLTPEYSGATRILQNFITTGVALAEKLTR